MSACRLLARREVSWGPLLQELIAGECLLDCETEPYVGGGGGVLPVPLVEEKAIEGYRK